MKVFLKTKAGVVLVGFSVLAVWALLAAQSVQAHESTVRLPAPTCGNLPSESGFLTAIAITSANLEDQSQATTQGGGVTGRGDNRFRYARITIPALAAGELRVFDATAISDAVLCRGSSQIAKSITSYSAHNTALAAANRADDNDAATTTDAAGRATAAAAAATAASTAAADDTTTPSLTTRLSRARSALSTARSALSTARSALSTARSALSTARSALSTARSALSTARSALSTAASALKAANAATANITTVTECRTKLL